MGHRAWAFACAHAPRQFVQGTVITDTSLQGPVTSLAMARTCTHTFAPLVRPAITVLRSLVGTESFQPAGVIGSAQYCT